MLGALRGSKVQELREKEREREKEEEE